MKQSKDSLMRKKTIIATTNLPAILCLIILTALINCAKTTRTNQPESDFRDPVIWDLNSLYEHDRVSNNIHLRRDKRSTSSTGFQQQQQQQQQQKQMVDACQSKMEVLTPYYATNSKGKLRTIVNSELMQQAIQVETCTRSTTSLNASKCNAQLDCGCEQKYKWHRLLVLDPRDTAASKGLFMDWFLFPSSCVCRCRSGQFSSRQFLHAIKSK